MKILFTGASSATGLAFAGELARAGHEVTCTFTRRIGEYEGVRAHRVERLLKAGIRPAENVRFGSEAFLDLVRGDEGWDLLCHHAAQVGDYRSPDFDVGGAVAANTRNLRRVLEALARRGCRKVVLTGSVFEPGEGAGDRELRAFSPYGLSKGLTARVFEHFAGDLSLDLGKFVIPNPFGPFEEPRFTDYLVRSWCAGEEPEVRTPEYVRDNIHLSLLARCYRVFCDRLFRGRGGGRMNPSGYVGRQGDFACRFAREIAPRLKLSCPVRLAKQVEWTEPRIRINTEPAVQIAAEWNEEEAWDEVAEYYRRRFGLGEPAEPGARP